MKKNNCKLIRQQLDELMLNEPSGPEVAEHLEQCSECSEFHQTQTKLRRMVGSLGTVAAPADFDFRLRARLANESNTGFNLTSAYLPFARRAFAVVVVLLMFVTGVVVVRNVLNRPPSSGVAADQGTQSLPPVVGPVTPAVDDGSNLTAVHAPEVAKKIRSERPSQIASRIKRPVATFDFSSQRAEVISEFDVDPSTPIFAIDTSQQSVKVSLEDGRGNERTISVPAIRFGSQRILPNGDQLSQKRIW